MSLLLMFSWSPPVARFGNWWGKYYENFKKGLIYRYSIKIVSDFGEPMFGLKGQDAIGG